MKNYIITFFSISLFAVLYFGVLNTSAIAGVPMCMGEDCTTVCIDNSGDFGDSTARCEGTEFDDVICGLDDAAQPEIINGGSGDDLICGFAGDDVLKGGYGDDILKGGDGQDDLHGGWGEDDLFGDGDDDTLQGGRCVDELDGGADNDDCKAGWGDNNGDDTDASVNTSGESVISCGELVGLDSDLGKDDDSQEGSKCDVGTAQGPPPA